MTLRRVLTENDLRELVMGQVVRGSGNRVGTAGEQEAIELVLADVGFSRLIQAGVDVLPAPSVEERAGG